MYAKRPTQKAPFKVYTKNQLIKKLKADNLFNWESVKVLDIYNDYIYEYGSYYEIQCLSDRGQEGAYKRIQEVLTAVKEEFIEPALERERQYQFDYVIDCVEDQVPSEEVSAVKTLLVALLRDAPTSDLIDFDFDNLKYDITAEEYISISVGASVWSYYVEGSIEINGHAYFQKPISYRESDARRL